MHWWHCNWGGRVVFGMPVNQKIGEQLTSKIKPSRHGFVPGCVMNQSFALRSFLISMRVSFSSSMVLALSRISCSRRMKSSIDCIYRLSNAAKRGPFFCCSPITLHLKCVIASIEFSFGVSIGSADADSSIVVSAGSAEDDECC